jgi:hypothetical protein
MPLIKRNRWLSGKQACELLGIEGTKKTPATSRLSANAENWGIRKIHRGPGIRSAVVYPELDLYEYMDRKEREAEKNEKRVRRPARIYDPKVLQARANKRWLSSREAVYRLGLVKAQPDDTSEVLIALERKAINLLNRYALSWRIRKIYQRGNKKNLVSYPEEDILVYMHRKEEEAKKLREYMRCYPTYYPPVSGPGIEKWWGDKKLEEQLQLGVPARKTGKFSARYTVIEMAPDDSVPPLRGYVETSEVARRFNLLPGFLHKSHFWGQFCIYLEEPWHSSVRFNGDLIEQYFKEKQEAGEKVYRRTNKESQDE